MLMLLSPAKNLDETTAAPSVKPTQAALLAYSEQLIGSLKALSPQEYAALVGVSDKIALLNTERHHNWQQPFTEENAKAAVFLFNGDVYSGLDAYHLSDSELQYVQKHTAILSGLYGLLRPFDLIQPYRLEMGTALACGTARHLYEFWGDTITGTLNERLHQEQHKALINLASQEYFKAVHTQKLDVPVITPVFKDHKNGQYKIISFYAKRARGLMVRYAAQNAATEPEDLQGFNLEGYYFVPEHSDASVWVFHRDEAAQ